MSERLGYSSAIFSRWRSRESRTEEAWPFSGKPYVNCSVVVELQPPPARRRAAARSGAAAPRAERRMAAGSVGRTMVLPPCEWASSPLYRTLAGENRRHWKGNRQVFRNVAGGPAPPPRPFEAARGAAQRASAGQ